MRGWRGLPLVASVLVFLGRPLVAQEPAQYVQGPAVALPDSLREHRGDFTIRITRTWSSGIERELLRRAETLYPPESAIEEAAESHLAQYEGLAASSRRQRFEDVRWLEGMRWWWLDAGWVLTPFALTGEAVQHFVERIRELSRSEPPRASFGGEERFHRGGLEYSALVLESGVDGFIVELDATWRYHCGSLCGLWFSAHRRVTFDRDGRLVRVEGDGPCDYMVR